MSTMKTEYYPGETITIRLVYKDMEGNYVDLDTGFPLLTFCDPTGQQVGNPLGAERKSTGIYELDWNIPTSGNLFGTWTIKIIAQKGSFTRKRKITFKVAEF